MNGGGVVASSWRYKQIDRKLLTFQSERLIRYGKQKSTMHKAKYFLGLMYEYGQGVDSDFVKAIEYYKASKGERDAEERIVKLSN